MASKRPRSSVYAVRRVCAARPDRGERVLDLVDHAVDRLLPGLQALGGQELRDVVEDHDRPRPPAQRTGQRRRHDGQGPASLGQVQDDLGLAQLLASAPDVGDERHQGAAALPEDLGQRPAEGLGSGDGQDLRRPVVEGLDDPRVVEGHDTRRDVGEHRLQVVLEGAELLFALAQQAGALRHLDLEVAAVVLDLAFRRLEVGGHHVEGEGHGADLVPRLHGQSAVQPSLAGVAHGLGQGLHRSDHDAREQQVQEEQQQHEGRAHEAVEEAPGEDLRAAQLGQGVEQIQPAEGLVAGAQLGVVMEDALSQPHRLAEAARGRRGQVIERLAAGRVDGLAGHDRLPTRTQHGDAVRPEQEDGMLAEALEHRRVQEAGHQRPDRRWRRGSCRGRASGPRRSPAAPPGRRGRPRATRCSRSIRRRSGRAGTSRAGSTTAAGPGRGSAAAARAGRGSGRGGTGRRWRQRPR